MKFKNLDLDTDFRGRLQNFDEITLGKDVIDNDGEPSYYLDVNDIGYSYVNESDRDEDFKKLSQYIVNQLIKEHENDDEDISSPIPGNTNG